MATMSASISELSLYKYREARVVAGTPNARVSGHAQWCPVRTAIPALSKY